MGATYRGPPVNGTQERIRLMLIDFPRKALPLETVSCGGRMQQFTIVAISNLLVKGL